MKYKSHIGLGFTKLDREVMKVSVNSRVIVDPHTFRRTKPNYPVSDVHSADLDLFMGPYRGSGDEECCCYGNVSPKWSPLLVNEAENANHLELEVNDNRNKAQRSP